MAEHQLQKLDSKCYRCYACQWQWQSKPRTRCPGVRRYDWSNKPEHLQSKSDLKKQNLKPKSEPVGCIWLVKSNQWLSLYDRNDAVVANRDQMPVYNWDNRPDYLFTTYQLSHRNLKPLPESSLAVIWSNSEQDWVGLYSLTSCQVIDPSLPPYCPKGSNPKLKTEKQMVELNLSVEGVKPRGFYRWYDRHGYTVNVFLYHPDDCKWQPKDEWICKTTLKKTYLLSNGWIKRLGEPDLITENPHHHMRDLRRNYSPANSRKFADMQLYSKQRVEAFLAEHAEEYALWLDERDRYVAIFEINREKIEALRAAANKNRQQEKQARYVQTALCLRCASGCAMPKGFLCAIHPMGLALHQIPCPDWLARP